MANVKISGLPAASALAGTEVLPVVQSSDTAKATVQQVVDVAITQIVDSAPSGLNTLNEIAAAINDDPAFFTTVNTALALKADLASPALTGNPTAPTQSAGDSTTKIATTAFVSDAVGSAVNGLSWKQAVRAATTAAGTLATDFENGDTIDGVVLATGDRILIKNQAAGAENGIYIVAASGAPTRAADANAAAELVNASMYVSEGTTLADTQWTCSTNATIVVGTTALTFAQLTSGGGGTTVATDTIWDTKGDLAVATGANTAAKLVVGTNGQVLTADSAEATGTKWATPGTSAGRHMVPISAAAMAPSSTGGCADLATLNIAAGQPDIHTLDFDATTQEYAQFSLAMPDSWDEGTITFVPIWSHAATTTNFGVVFDLQAVAFSNDDAMAAAFGTAQTSTDTGGTTNDLYLGPESSAITVAGTPAAGDVVFFRLSRVTGNGSDTIAIDARLHGIKLFITTNAETD